MRALGPIALFVFGLVLRLLFQAATPDGGTGWHVGFQGDAPVWQDLSARIAQGIPDLELRLPYRPPGMTWGLAWAWNGEGATLWPVRLLFPVLGAATAPLLWLLLRPHLAPAVAWLAAVWCAAAGNMLLLSSGLHAETPYLFLVLVSLLDQQRLARGGWFVAWRWGVLHGLLCLLRAEHVLTVVALAWVARRCGARWRTLAIAALGLATPLLPWQLHANRLVAAFNAGTPELPRSDVAWSAEAVAKLREMPSFQQAPMHRFVTDTMRVRGRTSVQVHDLEVVREAFGTYPEPLRPAFVALQGAMNFWLASTPEGGGGYSGASLDRPPPLLGGADRYPAWLAAELPRGGKFSLNYPPHLDIFLHGYARGFAELAADPAGALGRLATKLWNGVGGATGGLGGHALPIGLSGVRRPVDMVAATGAWAQVWRALVLGVALCGLWRLRRVPVLWPLLAFVATRVVVLAAFYGHARFGALCLPVVAIGVAAAVHAACVRGAKEHLLPVLTAALMAGLLLLEVVRWGTTTVEVDGRPFTQAPGGMAEYQPHTITFR